MVWLSAINAQACELLAQDDEHDIVALPHRLRGIILIVLRYADQGASLARLTELAQLLLSGESGWPS